MTFPVPLPGLAVLLLLPRLLPPGIMHLMRIFRIGKSRIGRIMVWRCPNYTQSMHFPTNEWYPSFPWGLLLIHVRIWRSGVAAPGAAARTALSIQRLRKAGKEQPTVPALSFLLLIPPGTTSQQWKGTWIPSLSTLEVFLCRLWERDEQQSSEQAGNVCRMTQLRAAPQILWMC